MPQYPPIRPLFVSPKTTLSYQQSTPNPPKKRNSTRVAPRACSVSPVDTSFEVSFSTADEDEYESGSSSTDVSPIEDLHRPLPNRFQVQGKPPLNTTALDVGENSHPSVAPPAQAGGPHTHSANEGLSTITLRSQDEISRDYSSSQVDNISSMVGGIGDSGYPPRPMTDAVQPVTALANQRESQGHGPKDIDTDACTQSRTTLNANRSHSVASLISVSKQIIQVDSTRQTTRTNLSKRGLKSTVEAGQSQTQLDSTLNKPMKSAEGVENARKGHPDITKLSTREGISQPCYLSDKESKNHSSCVWPKFDLGINASGKSPREPTRYGQSQPQWNRSYFVDQPPSRFSDTSCSTTTYDSPPSTPEKNFERRIGTPSLSIVSRKRPVQVPGRQSINPIRRKPTPSEAQRSLSLDTEAQGNEKPLPKSPPEVQAVTRVASLEAKLEALRRRRTNLQTVVNELTSVTQRSPIAYDMASRQKMKKTIEGLSNEISGVGKEEHETGLQLHRAWKREEQTSTYESSSLWVKRLAS